MREKLRGLSLLVFVGTLVVSFQNCSGLNSQSIESLLTGSGTASSKQEEAFSKVASPIDSITSTSSVIEWVKTDSSSLYTLQASSNYKEIQNSEQCSSEDVEHSFRDLPTSRVELSNLRPGFFYFYKICATTSSGVKESSVMSFKTLVDLNSQYLDANSEWLLHESGGLISTGDILDRLNDFTNISYFQNDIIGTILTKGVPFFIKSDGRVFTFDREYHGPRILEDRIPVEELSSLEPISQVGGPFFYLGDELYKIQGSFIKRVPLVRSNIKEVHYLSDYSTVFEMNTGDFLYASNSTEEIKNLNSIAMRMGLDGVHKIIKARSGDENRLFLSFIDSNGNIGKILYNAEIIKLPKLGLLPETIHYTDEGIYAGLTEDGILKVFGIDSDGVIKAELSFGAIDNKIVEFYLNSEKVYYRHNSGIEKWAGLRVLLNGEVELKYVSSIEVPANISFKDIINTDYGSSVLVIHDSELLVFENNRITSIEEFAAVGGEVFANKAGYAYLEQNGKFHFFRTQFDFYKYTDDDQYTVVEDVKTVKVGRKTMVLHKNDGSVHYIGYKKTQFYWANEDVLGVKKSFRGRISKAYLTRSNQLNIGAHAPPTELRVEPAELKQLECEGQSCSYLTNTGELFSNLGLPFSQADYFMRLDYSSHVIVKDGVAKVRGREGTPLVLSNSVESVTEFDRDVFILEKDKTTLIYKRGLIGEGELLPEKIKNTKKVLRGGILTQSNDFYYFNGEVLQLWDEKVAELYPVKENDVNLLVKTVSGEWILIDNHRRSEQFEIEPDAIPIFGELNEVIGLEYERRLHPIISTVLPRYLMLFTDKPVKSYSYRSEYQSVLFEDGAMFVCRNGNSFVELSELCGEYNDIKEMHGVFEGNYQGLVLGLSKNGAVIVPSEFENMFSERVLGQVRSGVTSIEYSGKAFFAIKFNGDRILLK